MYRFSTYIKLNLVCFSSYNPKALKIELILPGLTSLSSCLCYHFTKTVAKSWGAKSRRLSYKKCHCRTGSCSPRAAVRMARRYGTCVGRQFAALPPGQTWNFTYERMILKISSLTWLLYYPGSTLPIFQWANHSQGSSALLSSQLFFEAEAHGFPGNQEEFHEASPSHSHIRLFTHILLCVCVCVRAPTDSFMPSLTIYSPRTFHSRTIFNYHSHLNWLYSIALCVHSFL